MFKIGNVTIENPIVIAPLAGVSKIAFRKIAKQFGAGLVCNEMVSDKALFYQSKKTIEMCASNPDEHPLSFQLFGHDLETVIYGAKYLDTQTDCDIIDFNMNIDKQLYEKLKLSDDEIAYIESMIKPME